jgi:hypothetical protein
MKVPRMDQTTLRVLLIQHSLSGETKTATHEFVRGLRDGLLENDAPGNNRYLDLVEQRIETEPPFRFPWNVWSFFDVMAETVASSVRIKKNAHSWTVRAPIIMAQPEQDQSGGFDLVVLGWQTWFLSPSLPVRLAIHDPRYQSLFQMAPVLLIGTHRNMWHRASRTLCHELTHDAHVQLVGPGINFVQSSAFLVSVVKTLRWQLQGEPIDAGTGGGATNAKEQAYSVGYDFAKQYTASNSGGGESSSTRNWPATYQGGKAYSTTLAFMEDLWFPLKRVAALVMGLFPPGSLYRKIVTVLYVPLLLSAIVLIAPPVLFVGSILHHDNNGATKTKRPDHKASTVDRPQPKMAIGTKDKQT